MGKKGDLSDFEHGMVVGARRAGLSISKTADRLGLSRTTIFRVYREWSEKEKISSEWQLCRRKCFVDVLRAAERKLHKSKDPSDLSIYQSLLSSFSAEVHTAKASYFHNKINSTSDTRNLFKTLNSLLCPPLPPPTTSLTADDFATFFTNKTRSISSQVSAPHMQELKPTTSTAKTPLFAFCPLTEAEVSKLLLSSHPTTCPLNQIPSHLLQAISPSLLPALTHIINISLLTGTCPTAFKQARVTPLH